MKLKVFIILSLLQIASTGWGNTVMLDLSSSGKKNYSVELSKNGEGYNLVVKEETSRGKFELLYEGQNLVRNQQKDGSDQYVDGYAKLVDRKNGTAHLALDNGVQIDIELQN